ncbi:hypothetical protein J7438_07475 [Thalassotalea sp. G20_0]|uniref:hypothetical protein n=1 Tax=Thalassotalea sp. G20_0 TaxID=2821093 RepID=UPI001ADC3F42|nr:hypothetical protein [Thalassotalea sp. G20_0]MBO9493925.1 hypothetical protein [Thalassotalea sp. G20_0]
MELISKFRLLKDLDIFQGNLMQASTSMSSIIQILPTQSAEASDLPDIPEPISCQFKCLGRTVSLLERTAVNLVVSLPIASGVAICVEHVVRGVAGAYASSLAGFLTGFVVGGVAGMIAEHVYVQCRHVAPTESPVRFTGIISHDPEQVV